MEQVEQVEDQEITLIPRPLTTFTIADSWDSVDFLAEAAIGRNEREMEGPYDPLPFVPDPTLFANHGAEPNRALEVYNRLPSKFLFIKADHYHYGPDDPANSIGFVYAVDTDDDLILSTAYRRRFFVSFIGWENGFEDRFRFFSVEVL